MAEAAKALCPICNEREADDGRLVCGVCMGDGERVTNRTNPGKLEDIIEGSKDKMSEKRTISKEAGISGAKYLCSEHGPHNGMTIGKNKTGHCKQCIVARRSKSISKTATSKNTIAREVEKSGDAGILVDFSEHKAMLDKVRELAREEIRTPGQQILFYIKLAIGNVRGGNDCSE